VLAGLLAIVCLRSLKDAAMPRNAPLLSYFFFVLLTNNLTCFGEEITAERAFDDYIEYLSKPRNGTNEIAQVREDSERGESIRGRLLDGGEGAFKAMEKIGVKTYIKSLHHDHRYTQYWRTYALAAHIDKPELGRPRINLLIQDRETPLLVKVWILRSVTELPGAAKGWINEKGLMSFLHECMDFPGVLEVKTWVSSEATSTTKKGDDGKDRRTPEIKNTYGTITYTGPMLAASTAQRLGVRVGLPEFDDGFDDAKDVIPKRQAAISRCQAWMQSHKVRVEVRKQLEALLPNIGSLQLSAEQERSWAMALASLYDSDPAHISKAAELLMRVAARRSEAIGDDGLAFAQVFSQHIKSQIELAGFKVPPLKGTDLGAVRSWLMSCFDIGIETDKIYHRRLEWRSCRDYVVRWAPLPSEPSANKVGQK
jgi:hypothetical protein